MTDVRAVLARHGIRPSKALGQNFLTDGRIPLKMAAAYDKSYGVLEIGPGLGALTVALADAAGRVVCLEKDRALLPALQENLAGKEQVTALTQDALKANFSALARQYFQGLRPVVCANLPYAVTSPLVVRLLADQTFETVTIMVQKEVAQRLCASPGSKEYGALSVYVQNRAKPEILFPVSPGCFCPQPTVASAVLRLTVTAPRCDHPLFERVSRAAFAGRRKTMANNLRAAFGLDRQQAEQALTLAGLPLTARGETLGISEFELLCRAVKKVLPNEEKSGILNQIGS